VLGLPGEHNQQIPSSVCLTVSQVFVIAGLQNERVIVQDFFGLEGLDVMPGDVFDVFFVPLKCRGFHSASGLVS